MVSPATKVPKGRDIVIDYLKALDIDYLFGVPGTNEIPIIDGTSHDGPKTNGAARQKTINYIPCLHENIAMGAAMGYARMTGKPGVVMLHVTPGIGHALGNLFNAYKSHMPLLILCGQQHSDLILQEPLLASDLVKVAEQYTKWSHEVRVPEEFPIVLQRALKLAITAPVGPVFLSIPWDYTIQDVPWYKMGSARVTHIATNFTGAPNEVQKAAQMLTETARRKVQPVIIVGDGVGAADAWTELETVAEKTGAYVYAESLSSMMNYPPHNYHYMGELPGKQQDMQKAILRPKGADKDTEVVFLCGFNAQAQIVAYDYTKGPLIPEAIKQVIYLHNDPWEIGKNRYGDVAILGDIKLTLGALAKDIPDNLADENNQRLRQVFEQRTNQLASYLAGPGGANGQAAKKQGQKDATIDGSLVAKALGELQEEFSQSKLPGQRLPLVLVNEAISDGPFFQNYLHYDEPNSYFCAEGGSLGFSMPASIGIKLAVGDERVVVNAVGDGSALFYPHAWWTVYKFKLPILYIITNNREYKTLMIGLQEIKKLYQWSPERDPDYLDMHQPPLVDFHKIATGFGVQHKQIATTEQQVVKDALREALNVVINDKQPYVLEILTKPELPTEKQMETLSDLRLEMEVVL